MTFHSRCFLIGSSLLFVLVILDGCSTPRQNFDLFPLDSTTFLLRYNRNGPLGPSDIDFPPNELEYVDNYVSYRCAQIAHARGFPRFTILHSHQTLATRTPRDRPFLEDCGDSPCPYTYSLTKQVYLRLLKEDTPFSTDSIIDTRQEILRQTSRFGMNEQSLSPSHADHVSYGPKKDSGTGFQGYSELRLSDDRFKVTYEGGHGLLTELRLYYRAAQLTLQAGFDYFMLPEYQSPSILRLSYQRIVSKAGRTINSFDDALGRERLSLPNLTTTIQMGKGNRPANSLAFDANDVIQTITPLLVFE